MQLDVLNIQGKKTGRSVELPDDIFGIEPNDHVIYLAVKQYLAAQRQGTHKVKTRMEVKGSSKKLHKQKGTGGARNSDKSGWAVDRKTQRDTVAQIHSKRDFAVGDGGGGHRFCDVNELILLVESQLPQPAGMVRSRLFDRARQDDFLGAQRRSGDEIRNDYGAKNCTHNPSVF